MDTQDDKIEAIELPQDSANNLDDAIETPVPKKKRRKPTPMAIFIDAFIVVLVVTGLYLILEPIYIHYMQDQLTDSLISNYENGDGTIIIDPNAFAVPGEEPDYTVESSSAAVLTPTPAPAQVVIKAIGRIAISRIKIDMPIAEGATKYNLRVAIGHYTKSVAAGQPGLAIYFGHRMYDYGRHFNRLGEVVIGDLIIVEDKENRYTYQVDKIDTVLPGDLGASFVAPPDGESRIMLVTCTPIRVASHRLLVKGTLIKTEGLG